MDVVGLAQKALHPQKVIHINMPAFIGVERRPR